MISSTSVFLMIFHIGKLRNSLSEIGIACKIIGDYYRDHFSGVLGERKDILQGRIAAANDCNPIVFEERSIACSAKSDTLALQLFCARDRGDSCASRLLQ